MIKKAKKINLEVDYKSDDYRDFIKKSVNDGSYFKDATDWYFLRYVNPFCERTILIFSAIISLVVLFYLVQLIRGTFPLVEEFPVIIKAKDQSLYYPHLLPIKSKDDKEVSTVDEAVAKYLLSVYIKDREEYDYSNAEIYDINQKFNRLKNTSSVAEYSKFKLFMSKDNPNSPIYNFGKNVVRKVKIESILFIKEDPKNLVTKAKNFLQVKLPTQAQVRFVATTETTREIDIKDTKEEFVADIGFTFSGASKDEKDRSLNFTVNNYQLYKVEK